MGGTASEVMDWAGAPDPCLQLSGAKGCESRTEMGAEVEVGEGVGATQGRNWGEGLPCGRGNQYTGGRRVSGVPAGTGREENEWRTGAGILGLGLGVAGAEVGELVEIES